MRQAKGQAGQNSSLVSLLAGLTRQLGMRQTPTQFLLDLNMTIVWVAT